MASVTFSMNLSKVTIIVIPISAMKGGYNQVVLVEYTYKAYYNIIQHCFN